MLLGRIFFNDERRRPEYERELVADYAVTSLGQAAAAGGSGISDPGAGDRRIDGPGSGRFHPADGTDGDAAVSGGRCALAASAVSGGGISWYRLPAVPLFSQRTRQWSSAD